MMNEFLQPEDQFTPLPFWFWNDTPDKTEIERQIDDFRSKGVTGFIIHPRIGFPKNIAYLSDEFIAYIGHAVYKAAANGMKVVLYDEGMYPSGSAHGMVAEGNPEYASIGLRMEEHACEGSFVIAPVLLKGESLVSAIAVKKVSEREIEPGSEIKLIAQNGEVVFEAPDSSNWSVLLFIQTFTGGTIRGIHFGEDDKEPQAPLSSDLLNPEAVKKFIKLTHERYYSVLGNYFGGTVIAMFTDEPDIVGRCARIDVIPWTSAFLDFYMLLGSSELDLPSLWFDTGGKTSIKRNNYRNAVRKRLEMSYYRPISKWCEEHGISLMGHPQASDEIGLMKYFHIPGQDLVWRWVAPEDEKGIEGQHSTMGKCTSDAARHYGMRRNGNECFGCCGLDGVQWSFSAGDMKWYLDWLFVRGVNLIVPHAFFYSLSGDARKAERPPDVGPNNIWWKHYHRISDYIKRLCWLMTDSVNTAATAVLCAEDRLPWEIVKPFYHSQIEFNYLEATLFLSESCSVSSGRLQIREQSYNTLIAEDAELLTDKVREKLSEFTRTGGNVILFNQQHTGIASENNDLEGIIEIDKFEDVIHANDSCSKRQVLIEPENKSLRVNHVIKGGIHFYLLTNEGEGCIKGDARLKAEDEMGEAADVAEWNAWEGTINKLYTRNIYGGYVEIPLKLGFRESIIYSIAPSSEQNNPLNTYSTNEKLCRTISDIDISGNWIAVTTSEENSANTHIRSFSVEVLESWTKWEAMENFSGTVIYENTFYLEEPNKAGAFDKIELDLGEVCEIAEVYINGKNIGFRLWKPFGFDITDYVIEGINSMAIHVTNSLANSIVKAGVASGLLGPVVIKVEHLRMMG